MRVAPSAPADALNEWQAADRDEAAARDAQASAAARRRAVVVKLREAGYTAADTGAVLGITKQRVYQLEKPRRAS